MRSSGNNTVSLLPELPEGRRGIILFSPVTMKSQPFPGSLGYGRSHIVFVPVLDNVYALYAHTIGCTHYSTLIMGLV